MAKKITLEGAVNLAAAVINQALDDITGTTKMNELYREDAVCFWNSEWCDFLSLGKKDFIMQEHQRILRDEELTRKRYRTATA